MTVNVLLTCFGKREDVTSCVTCYVISNHTSFCYIVDSANEMHLRVIAQPCAGVPKMLQNVARLHIVVAFDVRRTLRNLWGSCGRWDTCACQA